MRSKIDQAILSSLYRIEERLGTLPGAVGAPEQSDRFIPKYAPGGEKRQQSPSSFAGTREPVRETPDEVAGRLAYDSYAASEIIERLDDLQPWEVTALHSYEQAHKARKTVLEAMALRVSLIGSGIVAPDATPEKARP